MAVAPRLPRLCSGDWVVSRENVGSVYAVHAGQALSVPPSLPTGTWFPRVFSICGLQGIFQGIDLFTQLFLGCLTPSYVSNITVT